MKPIRSADLIFRPSFHRREAPVFLWLGGSFTRFLSSLSSDCIINYPMRSVRFLWWLCWNTNHSLADALDCRDGKQELGPRWDRSPPVHARRITLQRYCVSIPFVHSHWTFFTTAIQFRLGHVIVRQVWAVVSEYFWMDLQNLFHSLTWKTNFIILIMVYTFYICVRWPELI